MHPDMMNKLKAYKTERSSNSNSVSNLKQAKMCHSAEYSGFVKKCSKEKVYI